MLPTLVSRNDDIRRLVDRGYSAAFDNNHLVVRDIPYLDEKLDLQWAAIVTQLVFTDAETVKMQNHQVAFSGTAPYGLNGTPVPNLGDTPHTIPLSGAAPAVVVQRQFSNKPEAGYVDFFDKIERYMTIISGPAIERYGVTPYMFRSYEAAPDASVFKIRDTLTTLAEIGDLAANFADEVVSIIGLGGTGAYVLDFMVKTPVKEIRGFDADAFHVHNAFRSPGRLTLDELGQAKADVYTARYVNFRHGLTLQTAYIDENSETELAGVTFAFVCVDKGSSRAKIIDLLIAKNIPFIDVGMGLNRKRGPIAGSMRATYFAADRGAGVREQQLVPTHDTQDDIYKTNIQIGELNAVNAGLAVLLYKKQRGFYVDDDPFYHLLFELGDMRTRRLPHEV